MIFSSGISTIFREFEATVIFQQKLTQMNKNNLQIHDMILTSVNFWYVWVQLFTALEFW